MANLTISVDDTLIKRARIRAIEQGTSLSEKVREFLRGFVDESSGEAARQRAQATARLMASIESASKVAETQAAPQRAGRGARGTLRDELYAGDFRAAHRQAASPRKPTTPTQVSAARAKTKTRTATRAAR